MWFELLVGPPPMHYLTACSPFDKQIKTPHKTPIGRLQDPMKTLAIIRTDIINAYAALRVHVARFIHYGQAMSFSGYIAEIREFRKADYNPNTSSKTQPQASDSEFRFAIFGLTLFIIGFACFGGFFQWLASLLMH